MRNQLDMTYMTKIQKNVNKKLYIINSYTSVCVIFCRVVEGCTYVLHTASPLPAGPVKNPALDLIKPAVEGTTSVLKACHRARVKRVVLTSSSAAINGRMDR